MTVGRNERALRATLKRLTVADGDARAAMLITLAQRLDSGKALAQDFQQYRLALDAIERATTSTAGSITDEIRERRARRERDARGAEGESDTAP
jgi:hypothetical protein